MGERLLARNCLIVGDDLYKAYSSQDQEDRRRWFKLHRHLCKCERCGGQIDAYHYFFWRMFGICTYCRYQAMPCTTMEVMVASSIPLYSTWKGKGGRARDSPMVCINPWDTREVYGKKARKVIKFYMRLWLFWGIHGKLPNSYVRKLKRKEALQERKRQRKSEEKPEKNKEGL